MVQAPVVEDTARMSAEEYRAECLGLCEGATVLLRAIHQGSHVERVASEMTDVTMRCAEIAWRRLGSPRTAERELAMAMFRSVFAEQIPSARESLKEVFSVV